MVNFSPVLGAFLSTHPDWTCDTQTHELVRTVTFRTYTDGITFANKVAECAEAHNHHPLICIGWATVTIKTTTHDAGNTLTNKDFELAEAIELLIPKED